MKIDIELLERIVAEGASGTAVLAIIKLECERHEAKRSKRRPVERSSKRRKRGGPKVDTSGHQVERDAATLTDTPRARLFREGKGALLTLGISDNRAGGLIAQWLKLTNDDDQLVLATILKAQSLGAAEAPGWILATLKGKMNERSGNNSGTAESRTTAIVAGVAAAANRRFGGGGQQGVSDEAAAAGKPDPQFFGGR